jgi:hypothetical protein
MKLLRRELWILAKGKGSLFYEIAFVTGIQPLAWEPDKMKMVIDAFINNRLQINAIY